MPRAVVMMGGRRNGRRLFMQKCFSEIAFENHWNLQQLEKLNQVILSGTSFQPAEKEQPSLSLLSKALSANGPDLSLPVVELNPLLDVQEPCSWRLEVNTPDTTVLIRTSSIMNSPTYISYVSPVIIDGTLSTILFMATVQANLDRQQARAGYPMVNGKPTIQRPKPHH